MSPHLIPFCLIIRIVSFNTARKWAPPADLTSNDEIAPAALACRTDRQKSSNANGKHQLAHESLCDRGRRLCGQYLC